MSSRPTGRASGFQPDNRSSSPRGRSTRYVFRSHVEGPRWARCDIAIKNYCHAMDLPVEVDRDAHFLRETVRFKITGTRVDLQLFVKKLREAVEEWNR